jgi:DNA primase
MTELSPQAQAVLDAYIDEDRAGRLAVAAALQAAADHIYHDWSAFNCIDALCEIAAELETFATENDD